ncbi:MAG: pyridoxamine kinase [Lachnospiraceae bacterium]|nr:pyridoxamine kinase [Lachnospiraceae bacterium]
MEKYRQKKIAVINDISGYGRCSLTVAIPILSAMGIQACPVPTAILSNHTEFPVYFFDDYTEKMRDYIQKWKELGLEFDGIASGFLGSAEQIEIVLEFVAAFRNEATHIFIDPVMGDHGRLYSTYTEEMCEEMKQLVSYADIVTPNVTEACFLTGTPYKATGWTRKELLNMAMMLQMMGAKSVVITGVREGSFYTNVVLEQGSQEASFVKVKSAGNQRPGTGDVFSSVLSGAVLGGKSLKEATEMAARFVRDCITKSDELEIPHSNGVCFEEILGKLVKR